MRTATAVRLALGCATLLTVGASFGLHPEPALAGAPTAAGAIAKAQSDATAHRCLACLTHAAALFSRAAGILLSRQFLAPAALLTDPAPIGPLAGEGIPGRSPPARS